MLRIVSCRLLWPGAYDVLGHIEKASTETQETKPVLLRVFSFFVARETSGKNKQTLTWGVFRIGRATFEVSTVTDGLAELLVGFLRVPGCPTKRGQLGNPEDSVWED